METTPADDTRQLRARAAEWAEGIIKIQHPGVVKPQDYPYIEAVLQELLLFEFPLPDLAVGITEPRDGRYVITVKGYKRAISDKMWAEIFLGKDRDSDLCNITDTSTLFTKDGVIKTIYVDQIQLHTVDPHSSSKLMKRHRSRK